MFILFPGIILTQAPQATSLGSKPYVALRIFLDIDGKRLERLDSSELLLTFVEKTGSIHRSRPQPVLPVAINTIGITSRNPSIGLENLLRSGSHIHSDDTITIGSHPQIVFISKERMNIILAHSRLARIRNKTVGLGIEAVESGIIGSYPDAMLLVFEESSYHITAQSPLAGWVSTETLFNTRRRKIIHTSIESSNPDAAFIIARNTINKTLARAPARIVYFRQHTPDTVLNVILHQSIIAGYENILVAVVVKLVDMMNCITQSSADELLGTTIGV